MKNSESFALLRAIFVVVCVSISSTPAVSQSDEMTWHHERDLDVSFAYPQNWVPSPPVEQRTRFVTQRLSKSGGLMAVCYLRVSELTSDVVEQDLESYFDLIRDSFVIKTLERVDSFEVRRAELSRIDGKDAIYIEADATIKSIGKETNMRVYTLLTYWRRHEIALECGSEVPLMDTSDLTGSERDQFLKAIENIESEIMRTLRTLHFERR